LQRVLDAKHLRCHTAEVLPHGYIPWPPRGCDPGAFFLSGVIVNRCAFLVDGLNLHHSALDAEAVVGRRLRRLDVASLCGSYIHALPGRSAITTIDYFSAVAHHREAGHPSTVARQVAYFSALQTAGVDVHLGQFKAKTLVCPLCGGRYLAWEEKETDVAIGARLLELLARDRCDTAVLMTGDTDLVPAMRAGRRLRPDKRLGVIQPYRRVNRELSRSADFALTIRAANYARHQLSAPSGRRRKGLSRGAFLRRAASGCAVAFVAFQQRCELRARRDQAHEPVGGRALEHGTLLPPHQGLGTRA